MGDSGIRLIADMVITKNNNEWKNMNKEIKPVCDVNLQNGEEESVCPNGETFRLPSVKDFEEEFTRLTQIVKEQRLLGHEIVVVMGVGFVGSVMAGVIADKVCYWDATPITQVVLENSLFKPWSGAC